MPALGSIVNPSRQDLRPRHAKPRQLECLRTLGCEQAQGFFFSRPVTGVEAGTLIAAQPWRGLRGSGVALR
jgi:hypothetical protein